MDFFVTYLHVLRKYVCFSGRSGRREFWSFTLASGLLASLLTAIDHKIGGKGLLALLYYAMTLAPALGVTTRRLHDTNRSGSWVLIFLVPVIGVIISIYLLTRKGDAGQNRYGGAPRADVTGSDEVNMDWVVLIVFLTIYLNKLGDERDPISKGRLVGYAGLFCLAYFAIRTVFGVTIRFLKRIYPSGRIFTETLINKRNKLILYTGIWFITVLVAALARIDGFFTTFFDVSVVLVSVCLPLVWTVDLVMSLVACKRRMVSMRLSVPSQRGAGSGSPS